MTRLNITPAPYGFHRFAMATVVTKDSDGKVTLVENADRVWIRANGAFRFGIPGQSLGLWPSTSRVVAVISVKGEVVANHVLMLMLGGHDLSTVAGRASFCAQDAEIMDHAKNDRIIMAIKVYREKVGRLLGSDTPGHVPYVSLLESRNAVYDAIGKPHN